MKFLSFSFSSYKTKKAIHEGVRFEKKNSVAHLAWCATECQLSVVHLAGALQNYFLKFEPTPVAGFLWRTGPCAPQKSDFLWRTGLGAPQKSSFLWRMGKRCATESPIFLWRTCIHAPQKYFCGAPIKGALQNVNLPISLFLAVSAAG